MILTTSEHLTIGPLLHFQNFFHFGLIPADAEWHVLPDGEAKPHEHAARLRQLHMPLVERHGVPALLLPENKQWYQSYFYDRAQHFEYATTYPALRSCTWGELAHRRYRRRVAKFQRLRTTFPSTPFYIGKHLTAELSIAMALLVARAAAPTSSISTVAIKPCCPAWNSDVKVRKTLYYRDDYHLDEPSAPNWLASDMALYYLSKL